MTLPNFRRTVQIKFWSLRNAVGPNLGVIYDVDTEVVRDAYRTRTVNGWKWQIKGLNAIRQFDPHAITDQEIFDEYGESLEFEYVT